MAGKSPREAAQARAKARQARARIRKGSKGYAAGAYRKESSLGRDMLSLGKKIGKALTGTPLARPKTPAEKRSTKYPAIGKKKTGRKKY